MAVEMTTATKRNPSPSSTFVPQPLPRSSLVAPPIASAPPSPSQPLLQPSSISPPYGTRSTSSTPPSLIQAATVTSGAPTTIPSPQPSPGLLSESPPTKIATGVSGGGKRKEKASDEPDRQKKLLNYGDVVVNLFPVLELAKTWEAIVITLIIALLVYGGSPSVVPYLLITLCIGLFLLDFAVSQVEMFPVLASLCGLLGKNCVLFVVPFIVSKNLSKELAWIPMVCYTVFVIAQPIGGYIHMVRTNRKPRVKEEEKG